APEGGPGDLLAPVHDQNGRAASGWSRLRPASRSRGRTGVASKERAASPPGASRRAVTMRRARSSRLTATRPCTSIYTERPFAGKTPGPKRFVATSGGQARTHQDAVRAYRHPERVPVRSRPGTPAGSEGEGWTGPDERVPRPAGVRDDEWNRHRAGR